MLQSANDVCAGAAEHISGSDLEFAKLMTKRAKEIGCVNTHFTNPHGLHDDKHYTCAYDMCLIGREAMKNSIFRKVTASRTYTVSATNMSPERTINNHHQMVNGYRSNYIYEYENCIGGKTGYTSAAENTLVTFAKKDDMELVCVVMRAQSTNSRENQYTDTKSFWMQLLKIIICFQWQEVVRLVWNQPFPTVLQCLRNIAACSRNIPCNYNRQ